MTTRALLDTGAKVSVMDVGTMRELKLEHKLMPSRGQVFGVCNIPVRVIGYVDAPIKITNESSKVSRIQVLEGHGQALLLGRQFMQLFGCVTFDWSKGTVGLGNAKIPIFAKATGGDPLERAKTAKQVLSIERATGTSKPVIDPQLTPNQWGKLTWLVGEYDSIFDERPGRTNVCQHMPFGLVNSQATFQQMIDCTLKGLKHTESYIDDCIIYSQTFEQHLVDLQEVLERMKQANIHIRYRKCQLGYDKVEFLGHSISEEGRRPLTSAAEKSNFPRPTSVKELQRFLGSLNSYRPYIPNLAELAVPLYRLTEKGAIWEWSVDIEGTFRKLRDKLVKEPVTLAFPNWERNFTVETDASVRGIAGVLSQKDKRTGQLRPIDYFSSSLSPAQRNYSAGQLEAWALVAACRKWNVYLRGSEKVELITDHNPLRWLRKQRDPRHTFALDIRTGRV